MRSCAPPPGESPDADGLAALQDLMERLQLAMADEHDRLRDEWDAHHNERAVWDHLQRRIQSAHCPERDRIRINVSGKFFEMQASHCVSNSAFFYDLRKEVHQKADPDGFVFIDRDPTLVHVVFSFLRHGWTDLSGYSENEIKQIKDDSEFYKVPGMKKLIEAHIAQRVVK